ncbi:MAG: hypothetical protein SP4CHLAM5_00440 [Chlamydiia bacterium]|nr:hypothetical protein [Chlamydiia bacterium]MCH9617921.1 hypothetical protein [Chlamydiia bacterium]MCH9624137.1 hypothetical protein [Chlamydiia bacterium]
MQVSGHNAVTLRTESPVSVLVDISKGKGVTNIAIEAMEPLKPCKKGNERGNIEMHAKNAACSLSRGAREQATSLKKSIDQLKKGLVSQIFGTEKTCKKTKKADTEKMWLGFVIDFLKEIRAEEVKVLVGDSSVIYTEYANIFEVYKKVIPDPSDSKKGSKYHLLKAGGGTLICNLKDLLYRINVQVSEKQQRLQNHLEENAKLETLLGTFAKRDESLSTLNREVVAMLLRDFKGLIELYFEGWKKGDCKDLPVMETSTELNQYIERERIESICNSAKTFFKKYNLGDCPLTFLIDTHVSHLIIETLAYFKDSPLKVREDFYNGISKTDRKKVVQSLIEHLSSVNLLLHYK